MLAGDVFLKNPFRKQQSKKTAYEKYVMLQLRQSVFDKKYNDEALKLEKKRQPEAYIR
jgi:hypothetical protein